MKKRMFTMIAAALALTATPVLAQSSDVQRLPAQVEQDAEELRGGFFIPLLAILAILAGIVVAVGGGDDNDLPTSP